MATVRAMQLADETRLGDYSAKNVMKQAGEAVLDRVCDRLPQAKRGQGKPLNGKVYSASVTADTEITPDALDKIAGELVKALTTDQAYVFVPLFMTHAVEKEVSIKEGMLRVVHWYNVTTSQMVVSFEIAAGKGPEIEVTMRTSPL